MRNSQNVRFDEFQNSGELEEGEYWSEEYFSRVYRALMDIIEAHGVGSDGWAAARWMVYEEYAHWDGIKIASSGAVDNAYGWLQSRLPPGERPQLEFEMFPSDNAPPPIWEGYNAMLPTA